MILALVIYLGGYLPAALAIGRGVYLNTVDPDAAESLVTGLLVAVIWPVLAVGLSVVWFFQRAAPSLLGVRRQEKARLRREAIARAEKELGL